MLADLDDNGRMVLIKLLGWIAGGAVLVYCISLGIRSANKHEQKHARPTFGGAPSSPPPPVAPRAQGFPVQVQSDNRPGTFLVIGVDRESGLDVRDYIKAESPANAKVKAELKGVVVTEVQRA